MNPIRTTLSHCSTSVRGAFASRSIASPCKRICRPTVVRSYASRPEQSSNFRDKAAVGPFTWKAAGLFIATGTGLYFYFEAEKAKVKERKRQEHLSTSIGRPSIGGPFTLTTQHNQPFTHEDLLGKWSLIYFGFTNCPDICPEELDKMGEVVETLDKEYGKELVLPVFISCDPARDTVKQVENYVADFHPRLVGLTGTYEDVKKACKSYRVYFSTPPDAKASDDYLVDHSIFFYLMDPLGQFVDAFGKNTTADEVVAKTREAVQKWEKAGGK
ncbi:protein SCO1, partial [Tremellales sp. Uapishka_1]